MAGVLQRIEDGDRLPQPPDEGGLTLEQRLERLSERLAAFVEGPVPVLE